MKTLYLILPAYIIIASALAVMEINSRLASHYETRWTAAIEKVIPDMRVGMQ